MRLGTRLGGAPLFDALYQTFLRVSLRISLQERKQQEEAMKKHEMELDYLAPFLAQIGDPPRIIRQEAYKLKEECLQDLKQRLIDKANLIQARFEKVISILLLSGNRSKATSLKRLCRGRS